MTHANFDTTEIDKFQQLADRWWDPHSEFRPLHEINPLRLQWIDDAVTLRGKRVLDVGCGGGILVESMAGRGANVLGIDLADKPLKVATLHAKQADANVTYQAVSAEGLAAEQPGTFDVVTCMEMLEHVPHPRLVIEACAALVRPGGWVFFSTINRTPFAWLIAVFGAERVLKLLPVGSHDYSKFIRPHELIADANVAGLTLKDARGLGYNPLTKKFRLHRAMRVGYLLGMKKG